MAPASTEISPDIVRTVLLQDPLGIAQIILPDTWLLDLKSLHEQTGRKLMPLSQTQLVSATRSKKLQVLDTAPEFFLLPTFLDESLTTNPLRYEIVETDRTERREIAIADLKALLRPAGLVVQVLRCALSPESLPSVAGAGSDLQLVSDSVQHFSALRIRRRLDETLEIPPLAPTAQRIIKLRSNPDATVSELTDIVEDDPSLAAQVVSWAASPYYAAPGKIRSVHDAIVRVLGFDVVSNLALGLVMGKTLSLPKDSVAGLTPYWLQSVYCSTAVESIVRQLRPTHRPSSGIAYLSGLLHNFGYLVLAHTFPPHFSLICRYSEANPGISHMAIERLLIGITREQIGALLMQQWRMPEEVAIALRHQHDPSYQGEHAIYAHLIFIALRLLRQQGIGDAPLEEIPAALYKQYGLDPARVDAALQLVIESDEIRRIAENFPQ